MKFKTSMPTLTSALSLASVVRPAAVDSTGKSGYLLVTRGDTCFVYSQDDHTKSRTSFPISDLDGDGSMVFPAGEVEALSYLDGDVTLESRIDGGDFVLTFETAGGASGSFSTFDPRALQSLDSDLEGATEEGAFPAGLLREALNAAKPYHADPKDPKSKEHHKCLQIFDASNDDWAAGNGHMFATNGYRALHFYCDEFRDRGLVLHSLRLPLLTSFLAKSDGYVKVYQSQTSTYFVNSDGLVIGWADSVAQHDRFSYYKWDLDDHIFRAPREILLRALTFVRKSLNPKKNTVRVQYDHNRMVLQFLTEDDGKDISSVPVGVVPVGPDDGSDEAPVKGGSKSKVEDLACNVNIDWLLDLVSPVKGHDVELRFRPYPKKPNDRLIRSIETFLMDGKGRLQIAEPEDASEGQVYRCQVTRFMPSKGG